MPNLAEILLHVYILIMQSSRNQIHSTCLETGGSELTDQRKKKIEQYNHGQSSRKIVHGSKDCTIAVAIIGILLTGFAVGYTQGYVSVGF